MITAEIDRRRQYDRTPAGGFREAGQKIVPRDDRRTMPYCSQKFFEIFSAQWAAMLLIAKHHCVVEIEDNATIRSLEQPELEIIETDSLEKNNHIVVTRFSQNAQPLSEAGTSRRDDRHVNSKGGIIIEAIPQPQPRAGGITVFDDAEGFHLRGIDREESFALQLPTGLLLKLPVIIPNGVKNGARGASDMDG